MLNYIYGVMNIITNAIATH